MSSAVPVGARREPAPDGLLLVDKPSGWTSHDVVARGRRLAATRRVGHAGTLDPLATGMLVLGIGKATKLLGHLALHDKDYLATIRLGVSTVTEDSEGEVVAVVDASAVTDAAVAAAVAALTGDLQQVPSAVSAIKVDGVRSYKRVRDGESFELPARPVHVGRFEVLGRDGDDLHVAVTVSTGTYVRALARDLGDALGVGAHLTSLRRTRIGAFTSMTPLDDLVEGALPVIGLADVLLSAFHGRRATGDEQVALSYGRALAPSGVPGPVGVVGPDGTPLALLEDADGKGGLLARPLVVFAAA